MNPLSYAYGDDTRLQQFPVKAHWLLYHEVNSRNRKGRVPQQFYFLDKRRYQNL